MIENLEGETWKNVGVFKSIDFTGYYEVSNKGRFKSINRTVICKDGIKRTWKERLLKQCNNNGYLTVYLTKDGKRTSVIAHQLVALRFVENPNPKEYIQRRGRVLRTNNGKKRMAYIHDVVVTPYDYEDLVTEKQYLDDLESNMISKQIRRVETFIDDSDNSAECETKLLDLKRIL